MVCEGTLREWKKITTEPKMMKKSKTERRRTGGYSAHLKKDNKKNGKEKKITKKVQFSPKTQYCAYNKTHYLIVLSQFWSVEAGKLRKRSVTSRRTTLEQACKGHIRAAEAQSR